MDADPGAHKGRFFDLDITLDRQQKVSPEALDAFHAKLNLLVLSVFPATKITIRTGITAGIEMAGFTLESDRETLSQLIQEVWEQDGWV